jgi:hypothetical protein
VANYALHYVGGPYGNSISADYFGCFDRYVRGLGQADGAADDFMAIMVNGCFGDINNVNVAGPPPEYPYPLAKADAVARRVGDRVWEAWRTIDQWDEAPTLAVAAEEFDYRRRDITDEQLAEAAGVLSGQVPGDELDKKYAEELIAVNQEPIVQPTVLAAFVLGPVGLATLPGEMFCQLGLDLKAQSPCGLTLIAGLGNDWLGYIGPKDAFDQGGYELRTARSAKAARGMGEALVDVAARLLNKASGTR